MAHLREKTITYSLIQHFWLSVATETNETKDLYNVFMLGETLLNRYL